MSENLKATLDVLRDYVNTHGLNKYVSLELEEQFVRISLLAEGRDLWLGRRYFLVADRTDEPQSFFELNEATLSKVLALPPGVGPNGEGHFLFVSYSRDDETLIAPVVDLLRVTDTEVFRDLDSIPAGDMWRRAIQDAIQQATECLVFWCSHSATSVQVGHEVDRALGLGKRMIPVLLDDSPLPEKLSELQVIDMRRFQPHALKNEQREASNDQRSGDDLKHVPDASPQFRKEALEYLKRELEELLRVERLRLSS